jgi:hypothetical protein
LPPLAKNQDNPRRISTVIAHAIKGQNAAGMLYTGAAMLEKMAIQPLKIDSLDLDLENPRITLASDQRDAMQKIINEQKIRLINLAESIAAKGLNPMDRLLVLRSDRQGKFIVIEGNRRVLAIKLLKNPSLVIDLEMPDAFKRRLQKAAQTFDVKKVEPIDCFEVDDRAQGNDWVRQRHIGADAGRGIVDWSAIASSRFRGRDPALQALDFVLEHANLTEDQTEQITGKFPLTTLDRLLSTPSVRAAIGFEIDKGKLLTELPAEEALKPLKRIVLDLAEKKINVSGLKSKEQQNDYIGKLKSSDRPNLSKKSGSVLAVEGMTGKDFSPKGSSAPKKSRAARAAPRVHIVPKSCKLKVTTPKIAGVYEELRALQLSKHVHAIGVLLRVFVEMSVDEYLTKTARIQLTFKPPKSNHVLDKNLKMKVKETIAHMVENGAVEKDFLGVTKGLTDPNHPFSIDTLHAYIHNRFFTPVDNHLTAAWDNAQPLFEKIWS